MKKEKFNPTKYKDKWAKDNNIVLWATKIKKEEKEEFDKILKKLNLSKPQFLRQCFENLKNKEN